MKNVKIMKALIKIIRIINTLADCEEILTQMPIYNENEEEYHEMYVNQLYIQDDIDICMINGGNTRLRKLSDDCYELFSSGLNWRDQEVTFKDRKYIIHKLYRNRKSINREFKNLQHEF